MSTNLLRIAFVSAERPAEVHPLFALPVVEHKFDFSQPLLPQVVALREANQPVFYLVPTVEDSELAGLCDALITGADVVLLVDQRATTTTLKILKDCPQVETADHLLTDLLCVAGVTTNRPVSWGSEFARTTKDPNSVLVNPFALFNLDLGIGGLKTDGAELVFTETQRVKLDSFFQTVEDWATHLGVQVKLVIPTELFKVNSDNEVGFARGVCVLLRSSTFKQAARDVYYYDLPENIAKEIYQEFISLGSVEPIFKLLNQTTTAGETSNVTGKVS